MEEQARLPVNSRPYEEYAIASFQRLCRKQVDELNGVTTPEYTLQHGTVATEIQKFANDRGWKLESGYKTYLQDLPVKVTFDVVKKYHQQKKDARWICQKILEDMSQILSYNTLRTRLTNGYYDRPTYESPKSQPVTFTDKLSPTSTAVSSVPAEASLADSTAFPEDIDGFGEFVLSWHTTEDCAPTQKKLDDASLKLEAMSTELVALRARNGVLETREKVIAANVDTYLLEAENHYVELVQRSDQPADPVTRKASERFRQSIQNLKTLVHGIRDSGYGSFSSNYSSHQTQYSDTSSIEFNHNKRKAMKPLQKHDSLEANYQFPGSTSTQLNSNTQFFNNSLAYPPRSSSLQQTTLPYSTNTYENSTAMNSPTQYPDYSKNMASTSPYNETPSSYSGLEFGTPGNRLIQHSMQANNNPQAQSMTQAQYQHHSQPPQEPPQFSYVQRDFFYQDYAGQQAPTTDSLGALGHSFDPHFEDQKYDYYNDDSNNNTSNF